MADSSGRAPAGWYSDVNQPGTERWWDGQAWTEHVRPAGSPPPPPATYQDASHQPHAAVGAPGVPAMSTTEPKRGSGCFGIATGVMVGIIAAVVILVGGCVAVIAAGSEAGNDDLVSVATSAAQDAADAGADDSPQDPPESTESAATGGEEADDVVSCTRTDPQSIVLEVVNNSPKTSSYLLTVGYFDDQGTRLADEATFVNYLRPGERAIEEHFTFEEQGTVCEVLDVDRFAAESIESELAEVSPCEIGSSADVLGSIQASVSATNSTPETSDYAIEVALVDADGVRRGSGAAFVESVRSGETAPSDVFTTLDFAEGYSCEVVAVTRNAS